MNELAKIREMKDLELLDDEFKKEEVMKKLQEITELSKEIEVGGQTSYQNKFFVLNEVEYPDGTSGKSRQAVFEASVRVDSLKGLVFDYHKTQGELKIEKAALIRAEDHLEKSKKKNNEADTLEAEGMVLICMANIRQKELSIEGLKGRTKHLLRSINDFDTEFQKNEELCKAQGFTVHDWNNIEVEDHYWRTVNDKKIIKAKMYNLAKLSTEQGDSLPLQHKLDVGRVQQIDKELKTEAAKMGLIKVEKKTD